MLFTQTVHPPAGANPLIMVYSHAGFAAAVAVIIFGTWGLLRLATAAYIFLSPVVRKFYGEWRCPTDPPLLSKAAAPAARCATA